MATKYIKRIQLSDGTVRELYDLGAARAEDLGNYLPLSGGSLAGDLKVGDDIVLVAETGSLTGKKVTVTSITIEEKKPEYIIVSSDSEDGSNELKKRSVDQILEDIGGVSCTATGDQGDDDGVLVFKVGK